MTSQITDPHVILLDLGLPDMDGLNVLKRLREWSETPVLVLSVRDDEAGKVAALDAGAEDYVTKPFSTPELLARLRAAQRKNRPAEETQFFEHGGLAVDLDGTHGHARGPGSETDRHGIRAAPFIYSPCRSRPHSPLNSARNLGPEIRRTPAIPTRLRDAFTPKDRNRSCGTEIDQDRIRNRLSISIGD